MTPSENAYKIIEDFEGYRDKAYPDPGTGGSPWTIGYGHTRGVKPGDTCTEEQAEDWLHEDVAEAAAAVNEYVTIPLSQNQFDALVSFTYNLGVHNLNRSTLLTLLNRGDIEGAADEFLKWDMAGGRVLPGLDTRRHKERELFLS